MANRILIVEDEEGIREIEKIVLQKDGYQVETAEDARIGLTKASAGGFDLIISDIMMPGMDGFQLLQELRKVPASKSVPVIFITAMDEQRDKIKGLNLGAVEYITKPFSTRELLEKIKEVLISTRA